MKCPDILVAKVCFQIQLVPLQLGNLGGAWPAVSKWRDLRWFREQHGHRNVPLEVGAYDDAANWREEVMLFSRFIDEYLLPGLSDELEPPAMTGGGGGGTGGSGGGTGGSGGGTCGRRDARRRR
jgi:hypothetical protein